jgi:hypothetical protein
MSFREKPRRDPAYNKGNEMIANALLFAMVILLGSGFWLFDQLKFMARLQGSALSRLSVSLDPD